MSDRNLGFTDQEIRRARDHAIEEFPRESCGYMAGGVYQPMPNKSENGTEEFEMDWPLNVEVQAVIHSHPNLPKCPSAWDMEHQISTAVPWGIIQTDGKVAGEPVWFGDQVPIPPLEEREFIHGVTDCYSIIRDYYRLTLNFTLPDFPRDFEWWSQGKNLYTDGIEKSGFRIIDENEVKVGDVFLAKVGSTKVTNHGGIILANGLVLHHLKNNLSIREPGTRWRRYVTHWLRHPSNEASPSAW